MRRAVAASIMIASAAFAVSACQLISGLDNLHEDTTSAGGASSSSSSSSNASSSSTGMCPGLTVLPPGGCPMNAPAPCGGGNCAGTCCDGQTCLRECAGTACNMPIISCVPGGMPVPTNCTIDCTGDGSCTGKTIQCQDDGICHVICSGMAACVGTTIACGSHGPCVVECSGGACSDGSMSTGTSSGPTEVKCGTGLCSVTCPNPAMGSQAPVVTEPNGTPCVEPTLMGCAPGGTSSSSSSASSSSGSGG